MIVSKMSETRTDVIPTLGPHKEEGGGEQQEKEKASVVSAEVMAYSSWSGDVATECRERTETEEEESRRMVRQVALQLVEVNMSLAKPICAAAHLVAVSDLEASVQLLMLCGGEAEPGLGLGVRVGVRVNSLAVLVGDVVVYVLGEVVLRCMY